MLHSIKSGKILITGGGGQIGPVLASYLRGQVGHNNVILSDIRNLSPEITNGGPFYQLDSTDGEKMAEIVKKENVMQIYHLAALLSGRCEEVPDMAFKINQGGLLNVLNVAKQFNCSVFHPSSIAVFGSHYNPDNAVQDSYLGPNSIYGITKVWGENICNYYNKKFGIDIRGIRYPGIISTIVLGGGTTDYAVYMLQKAAKRQHYNCFLQPDTRIDMMHIDDAVKATVDLMNADPAKLVHRNAFNVTAMNFTPHELHKEIQKHIPEFKVYYNQIDTVRQGIADSWPNSMSAQCAEVEWGFKPTYNLDKMVTMLLQKLQQENNDSLKIQQNLNNNTTSTQTQKVSANA